MTGKLQQVQNELTQLKAMLAAMGIGTPAPPLASDKDRADYIEHGGEQHATLLGLVKSEAGDEDIYIVYDGYRLENELAFSHHHDPRQAALLTLRQKISELKAGKPPILDSALSLQTPGTHDGATWTQMARAQGV